MSVWLKNELTVTKHPCHRSTGGGCSQYQPRQLCQSWQLRTNIAPKLEGIDFLNLIFTGHIKNTMIIFQVCLKLPIYWFDIWCRVIITTDLWTISLRKYRLLTDFDANFSFLAGLSPTSTASTSGFSSELWQSFLADLFIRSNEINKLLIYT